MKTHNYYYMPAKLKKFQRIAFPSYIVFLITYFIFFFYILHLWLTNKQKLLNYPHVNLIWIVLSTGKILILFFLLVFTTISINQRKYRKFFVLKDFVVLFCLISFALILYFLYKRQRKQKRLSKNVI